MVRFISYFIKTLYFISLPLLNSMNVCFSLKSNTKEVINNESKFDILVSIS